MYSVPFWLIFHAALISANRFLVLHRRKARTVKLHEVNFEPALLEKNDQKNVTLLQSKRKLH